MSVTIEVITHRFPSKPHSGFPTDFERLSQYFVLMVSPPSECHRIGTVGVRVIAVSETHSRTRHDSFIDRESDEVHPKKQEQEEKEEELTLR